jgi:uncharacterized membrane protein YuzA (DUF378 family)
MCKGKCCGKCCALTIKVLLIIGGLNWGLVGVGMLMGSDLNVVHMLLGFVPVVEGLVYVLVGLAALAKIFHCKCKECVPACPSCATGNAEGAEKNI